MAVVGRSHGGRASPRWPQRPGGLVVRRGAPRRDRRGPRAQRTARSARRTRSSSIRMAADVTPRPRSTGHDDHRPPVPPPTPTSSSIPIKGRKFRSTGPTRRRPRVRTSTIRHVPSPPSRSRSWACLLARADDAPLRVWCAASRPPTRPRRARASSKRRKDRRSSTATSRFVTTRLITALTRRRRSGCSSPGVASAGGHRHRVPLGVRSRRWAHETADLTGVDIMLNATSNVYADTQDEVRCRRGAPPHGRRRVTWLTRAVDGFARVIRLDQGTGIACVTSPG